MGQFSFQYPVWTIGLCLILAGLAGAIMYYKSTQLADRTYAQKLGLSVLRMIAVFGILLLILNPLYKYYKKSIQKPILVFAQDVSESIVSKDSLSIQSFIKSRDQLEASLQDKYDLIHLEFGANCIEQKTDQFDQKLTNINSVLDQISNTYEIEKIKGLVLISDGIQNTGKSPLYHSSLRQIPIYPILLGDTTPEKDLRISNLFFNEIVYAGDKFSVEVDLQAWNLVNAKSDLILSKFQDGKWTSIQTQAFEINQKVYFNTFQFIIQTESPGLQKFRLSSASLNGEVNTSNNTREFYIDILDSKKKILILSYSPHPDISAIKDAVTTNKNYELTVKNISDRVDKLSDYSLIIFHQLPGTGGVGKNMIEQAKNLKVPSLFILGAQTDIIQLNSVQDIIRINDSNKTSSEAAPVYKSNFNQFVLSDPSIQYISKLPPLNVPFGTYSLDPSASILFFQKIGSIETNYPMWVLSEKNQYRSSYILGEGIWKWKLNEFAATGNFNFFSELISKNIQYNTSKLDHRKFRISQPKRIYNEGETISFFGELYNDNNERINTPDINMTLTGPDKLNYNFTFSRLENYYTLDIGSLAPGEYNYQAQLEWNRQSLTSSGKFSIQALNLETQNHIADFNLLRNLAERSSGTAYFPDQLDALQSYLNNDQNSKSILIQNLEVNPLIDQKWIFFILFICLALEWFLRRYWGSY